MVKGIAYLHDGECVAETEGVTIDLFRMKHDSDWPEWPGRNPRGLRVESGLILSIALYFGNFGCKINKPCGHQISLIVTAATLSDDSEGVNRCELGPTFKDLRHSILSAVMVFGPDRHHLVCRDLV